MELGDSGIRRASWEELTLVSAWRQFLNQPQSYFGRLLASGD
jgi:hypothetical protein